MAVISVGVTVGVSALSKIHVSCDIYRIKDLDSRGGASLSAFIAREYILLANNNGYCLWFL